VLLRRVRLSSSREFTLSEQDTLTIFSQINRYLQDEDSVIKLLSTLPSCREDGISSIASGLFSPNPDIQRLATDILQKLEKGSPYGRQAVQKMNYFLALRYQGILQ
jgi:hypothetical protein